MEGIQDLDIYVVLFSIIATFIIMTIPPFKYAGKIEKKKMLSQKMESLLSV